MKKRIWQRALSAFLAMVMVVLLIPAGALRVNAVEERAKEESMTPLQKYRAETTESLQKINSYIKKREEEDTKLKNSFTTKIGKINKVAGGIGKVANATIAVYNAIDSENKWYENVANAALALVTSYLGVQLPGQETSDAELILSEVQNMINDLEKRLGEEFDVVNGNIDKLSEKVDDNSVALAAYVSEQIDKQDYKDALNRFTDDFNYYNYKKELATAYEALITTMNSSASEENIKKAYDNLYSIAKRSKISKDDSAGLYDYIMGSNRTLTDGYSIQEILYNYAVMKKTFGRENLEIECIEFAEDLYDTYVFSQYSLILCYNYQLGYLYSYTENPLGEHYSFYSQVQEKDVACSVILSNMECLVIDLENVNEKMAQYVCYVSNLESSFIYESGALNNHSLYKVPYKEFFSVDDYENQPFNTEIETISYADVGDKNYYIRTNNKVSAGDILYLNVMPELFASLFAIGDFYFEVDNESLATVNKAGVVEVLNNASGGSFTVTMYCNDNTNPMYSITFEIVAREYHGGLGTEKAPYLIATWEDIAGTDGLLNNEADYTIEGIYFELTNDISADGATFSGIPSFKGVFDGNGYSIHSFSISNSTEQTEKNIGFFITNEGVIKNVTIGNKDISAYNDHSVSIVSAANETSAQNHHSVGAIVGKNSGMIKNCFVDNVFVNGELYDINNNQHAFCYAGGIAGFNTKNAVIEQCSVENSTVKCYLSAAKDSGDNNYAYAGGIVGKNEGTVNTSVSHDNKLIRADARGDGKNDDNMAYPEAAVGGLIGDSRNGSADNSATYNNILEIYGSSGGNTSPTILKGLYIGVTKNTFLACKDKTSILNIDALYSNCSGGAVTGVSLNTDGSLRIPAAVVNGFSVGFGSTQYGIVSYSNDTNECVSIADKNQFATYLTDDCWYFDSGYPTLKPVGTITQVPEVSTGGLRIENVLEYYQGESYFKYITYVAGVAPEYRNETTHAYPLSSHRIDTSELGKTNVIVLSQDTSELHRYTKVTISISVVEAEVSEIYFYTMPVKTEYLIGDEVDTAGLKLFAKYKNDFCSPISLDDCNIQYDFSNQGIEKITIVFDEKYTIEYSVTVICGHKNTSVVSEQGATCNNVGYTAGTYCNDCQIYINGHSEIPVLNIHAYQDWKRHNDSQHIRECMCGAVEYENHTWNEGIVTLAPTQTATGIMTYTCTACSAVKNEVIPIPEISENEPTLYIKDIYATPGSTFSVDVAIKNNPGLSAISFTLNYDRTVLTLENVKNGGLLPSMTVGNQVVLSGSDPVYGDQTVVTLTFKINDQAALGDYSIGLTNRGCIGENETSISMATLSGTLTVGNIIWGDATGDGIVDITDVVRLMKYLAEFDYDTNTSPIAISAGADATGDGTVDITDVVRLMKYLAEYDYDTDSSPVVLGKPL